MGILIAAGLCATAVAACSDSIEPGPTKGTGGASGSATLVVLTLNRLATVGCSNLHLMTLNAPDFAGQSTANGGSFTLNSTDWIPQSNTYAPDVAVDLATGATGCTPP